MSRDDERQAQEETRFAGGIALLMGFEPEPEPAPPPPTPEQEAQWAREQAETAELVARIEARWALAHPGYRMRRPR